jgi:hypothetical protein
MNDYRELFGTGDDPDLTVRVFVLTELKDGRVRAQRVRSPYDPRLHDSEAFAIVAVDTLAADAETGDEEIRDIGKEVILRPRIYHRLVLDSDFLGALADAANDCTLEMDLWGDWYPLAA